MNWSFPLFRIFGIPVKMHWTMPVLMGGMILKGLVESGPIGAGWYACLMAGLFVTVVVHELGHCRAAISVGGHAHEITVWPMGGFAYVGHNGASREDIKVAAYGPLMHIPLAALCAVILLAIGVPWSWSYLNLFADWTPFAGLFVPNLLVCLLKMQIALFFLNMLVPAYPLDGGRILTDILLMRYDRDRAAMLTTWVSIPIGLLLLVWSLPQREILLSLIGFSILFESWRIHMMLRQGEIGMHPLFASVPEYDYMPERPHRPGFFARWRARRAHRRMEREAAQEAELQVQLDAVLEKISREGMGSLSPAEKNVLDEASRRARMK